MQIGRFIEVLDIVPVELGALARAQHDASPAPDMRVAVAAVSADRADDPHAADTAG